MIPLHLSATNPDPRDLQCPNNDTHHTHLWQGGRTYTCPGLGDPR